MLHFYFRWKDVSAYLDILNEWCTVFYSKYIFINFIIIFYHDSMLYSSCIHIITAKTMINFFILMLDNLMFTRALTVMPHVPASIK